VLEETIMLAVGELWLGGCNPESGQHEGRRALARIWDSVAECRPDLFDVDVALHDTTPLALALRFTLRRTPELVEPLVLSRSEQRDLSTLRMLVGTWSGIPWPPFQHLVFDPQAGPLREAWSLMTSGGVAFTFDPLYGDCALYSKEAVDRYRTANDGLVPILLHEEAHLAAAQAVPGSRGPCGEESRLAWEAAAQVVEQTAVLWRRNRRAPSGTELRLQLSDAAPHARLMIANWPALSTRDLVASAVAAAIRAARGESHPAGPPTSSSGRSPSSGDAPSGSSISDSAGRFDSSLRH
jgi:hypothetical protein